ncbi:hypothetical protein WICMUC_004347 [Wickerhamomyces mucosus]|uniref:Rho-GAP domain-containing protein n=1 Tax=Wickerhamomyces mucosus TaxID=1378264 RepID=A0A9P8PJ63_9ASCO|nr:hypothetical protein WICMUC_004347 [Wickerhamomyces mucosus]
MSDQLSSQPNNNPSNRIVSESSVHSNVGSADSGSIPSVTPSITQPSTNIEDNNEKIQEEKPKIVPASSPTLLNDEKFVRLLNSDSAVEALLIRLKKSIITCEEFAKYIRKRAILEQDHEEHLKKISRSTQDIFKNQTHLKSDSFTINIDKLFKVDDRIATQNSAYSKQLIQMYEELNALSSAISRQRKTQKETFKRKEKEVIDSISSAEKAKSKYDSLCIELERVRTTDPTKKTLTLRGSKTSSEQEEILHRKIEAAEADYRQKVSTSTGLRNIFLNTFRPSITKQLKDIIIEIDIAMSVQLQKYSTRTEDLALQTALSVNPLKGSNLQSMKSIASSIDNEKDLYQYVLKNIQINTNKHLIPVEYRQHPSMAPISGNSVTANKAVNRTAAPSPFINNNPNRNTSQPSSSLASNGNTLINSTSGGLSSNKQSDNRSYLDNPSSVAGSPSIASTTTGLRPISVINNDAPLPPGTSSGFKTFGTPINELMDFEGEMVPSIVRQCIYVVDKYGLELEGIYRTSGNIATVNQLKDSIDRDPSNIKLILPNPNSITDSDIYAVASLMKNYFSSLPEALLTNNASPLFLENAKIADNDLRLKKIHQVVYDLPDASYWTLRSLIFHLSKVTSRQSINLMNSRNLGIIWGPTLFPKDGDFNAQDMSYQGKVIEELIIHANDIFEAE